MIKTMRQMQNEPCLCGTKTKWGTTVVDCHYCIGDWLGNRARIKARSKKIEELWGVNDPKKVRKRVRKRRKKK